MKKIAIEFNVDYFKQLLELTKERNPDRWEDLDTYLQKAFDNLLNTSSPLDLSTLFTDVYGVIREFLMETANGEDEVKALELELYQSVKSLMNKLPTDCMLKANTACSIDIVDVDTIVQKARAKTRVYFQFLDLLPKAAEWVHDMEHKWFAPFTETEDDMEVYMSHISVPNLNIGPNITITYSVVGFPPDFYDTAVQSLVDYGIAMLAGGRSFYLTYVGSPPRIITGLSAIPNSKHARTPLAEEHVYSLIPKEIAPSS